MGATRLTLPAGGLRLRAILLLPFLLVLARRDTLPHILYDAAVPKKERSYDFCVHASVGAFVMSRCIFSAFALQA